MFKPVIIRAEDPRSMDRLAAVISAEQGAARERTITAADVVAACEEIAAALAIPKKHMEGISAAVDPHAQHVPSSYRYPMLSTQFIIEYKRGAWRLTFVCRSRVSAPSRRVVLQLPDAARAALLSRFSAWE